MKKLNIKKIGILFLMLLVLGSCDKWIDTDLNISPDNPSKVTMETLLPAIEARTAFTIIGGNDIVRVQAMWLQQLDGIDRQSLAETNYQLKPGDVNNMWGDVYAGCLTDLRVFIEYATEAGSSHNIAVGKILQAHILGAATDVWNDLPWSEALQGTGNFTPAFDSQEFIYGVVMTLLDEAIVLLEGDDNSGLAIEGDYFFGGDTEMWAKAAHSLMARYSLHLAKRDAGKFADVLEHIGKGISSNDEDFQFNYGPGDTESNPLYQFVRDRDDVRMNAYFVEMLKIRQDPRLAVFVAPDGNGEYTGSVTGSSNAEASRPGPGIAGATAPTYFVTFMEMLFDKAIAQAKTGVADATVRETLIAGLTASLEKYGVASPEYIAGYTQYLQTVSGQALYKEIVTQKYIALCYQSEAYNDWRLSENVMGIPVNPGGAETEIPRRFPYASDEISYNPNTPNVTDITARVWWDE